MTISQILIWTTTFLQGQILPSMMLPAILAAHFVVLVAASLAFDNVSISCHDPPVRKEW